MFKVHPDETVLEVLPSLQHKIKAFHQEFDDSPNRPMDPNYFIETVRRPAGMHAETTRLGIQHEWSPIEIRENDHYAFPIWRIQSSDRGLIPGNITEFGFPYYHNDMLLSVKAERMFGDLGLKTTREGRFDVVLPLNEPGFEEQLKTLSGQITRCWKKNQDLVFTWERGSKISQLTHVILASMEEYYYKTYTGIDLTLHPEFNWSTYMDLDAFVAAMSETTVVSELHTIDGEDVSITMMDYDALRPKQWFWLDTFWSRKHTQRALGNFHLLKIIQKLYDLGAESLNLGIDTYPHKARWGGVRVAQPGLEWME